jgi:hypothetical protein
MIYIVTTSLRGSIGVYKDWLGNNMITITKQTLIS